MNRACTPSDRRRMGQRARLTGLPASEIRGPRDSTALAGATGLPLGGRLRRFGVPRALLGSHLPNNERSGVYLAVELALPLVFALLLAFLGCRHGFFLLVTRNDTPSGALSRRSRSWVNPSSTERFENRSIPAIGTSGLPLAPASVGAACCDLGVALREEQPPVELRSGRLPLVRSGRLVRLGAGDRIQAEAAGELRLRRAVPIPARPPRHGAATVGLPRRSRRPSCAARCTAYSICLGPARRPCARKTLRVSQSYRSLATSNWGTMNMS
jgi:hypothetical protein